MVKCEFSGISNFASLLRYMTDFEETLVDQYGKSVSGAAAEKFSTFGEKHKRRLAELELARREKLREEILEPITDLDSKKYCPKLDITDPVKQAVELEEKAAKFYNDMTPRWRSIQGEIARICERFAKQSLDFAAKLKT